MSNTIVEKIASFQLEIRYSAILDFGSQIARVLTPFVKDASGINIDYNTSGVQNAKFSFDNNSFDIDVQWDRIIFRINKLEKLDTLVASNSIIQDPFFSMFEKVKGMDTFSEIKNFVVQVIMFRVDTNSASTAKEKLSEYTNLFGSKTYKELFPDANDFGLVAKLKKDQKLIDITFGPFLGIDDLRERNIKPLESTNFYSSMGDMLSCKVFEVVGSFTFGNFKEVINIIDEQKERLWKLIPSNSSKK